MLPLLTVSSMRTYRRCAREYFWRYERCLRPVGDDAHALRFGTRIHKGLETWFLTGADIDAALAAMSSDSGEGEAGDRDPYDLAKSEVMLQGYHARWANENFEVLAVEAEFLSSLTNPATGFPSVTWQLAGKLYAAGEK